MQLLNYNETFVKANQQYRYKQNLLLDWFRREYLQEFLRIYQISCNGAVHNIMEWNTSYKYLSWSHLICLVEAPNSSTMFHGKILWFDYHTLYTTTSMYHIHSTCENMRMVKLYT